MSMLPSFLTSSTGRVVPYIAPCIFIHLGKSDPFVTIKYGSGKDKERYRSKVIYNTLNPVWNETCRLPLPNEDDKMTIVSLISTLIHIVLPRCVVHILLNKF